MDKRKEKRIQDRNVVFIKSARESASVSYEVGINATTQDLSLGGAKLFTEKYFGVGTAMRIVIELARTSQSLQIEAEVKWAKKSDEGQLYEIGVEFRHNISQTILALIRHLYGVGTGVAVTITPEAVQDQKTAEPEKAPADAPAAQAPKEIASRPLRESPGEKRKPARKDIGPASAGVSGRA